MSSCEHVLAKLVHDLAQPLSNIETSAYCLSHTLDNSNHRAQEHLRLIQQQLDQASAMLSAAAEEVRSRRSHSVEHAPFELAAAGSR